MIKLKLLPLLKKVNKMYLYELHCHTSAASACARWTPEEMVCFYAQRGYSGIVVSDHFMNGNSNVNRNLPWLEQIELFCSGYERAKAEGKKYDMDVFFAFEYTSNTYYGQPDNPNKHKDAIFGCDFLIYGLDKNWLLSKDESILYMPVNGFLKMVREEGGTVIQAHPFRLASSYMDHISLFPQFTEGVEILNGNPNTMGVPNRMAEVYASEYGFFPTAGTDAHGIESYLAVTQLPQKVTSIASLIDALKLRKAHFKIVEIT